MDEHVTAVVFRYDPGVDEAPYYQEYRVPVLGPLVVLRLLSRIHNEIDPTLSIRDYCCGLQLCRSCVLRVNERKRVSCHALIAPGDRVVIEPVRFPEGHLKDLVGSEGVPPGQSSH